MKNMKKLIAMMLMMASVFFIACEDDGESTLSPEQAKTELNNLETDMSGYLEEMVNSKGMEAIEVLMAMPDPFAGAKANVKTSVIPNIHKFLLPVNPEKTKSVYEGVGFDFDTYKGYKYVYTTTPYEYFDPQPIDEDIIIIEFPTEGSTTNDAALTIHNYEEEVINEVDEWGYQYSDYYPTAILADLYINEIKIVEIDLDAEWDTSGEPSSFDISVYLTPFTFSGSFDHTATAASIDFDIKYNTEQIFAAGVNATFESSELDEPLTVGGYVQLLNVKVEATVDVQGIDAIFTALENQTSPYTTIDELAAAINDEIDAVVLVDGVKAADIEILYDETNAEEPVTIVFVFSDGTTEPALPYFEGFVTDIEDFFYFLDDVYGDW